MLKLIENASPGPAEKGRSELISLILGVLKALGPGKKMRTRMSEKARNDLRQGRSSSRELKEDLGRLASEAVAQAFSYEPDGDFREGWDYLSQELRMRRSSEEWLRSAEKERSRIPRAVFSPNAVGEVIIGGSGDLAVVEVFGINTEFHSDGRVVEEEGAVLAGMVRSDGCWYLESVSWHPGKKPQ